MLSRTVTFILILGSLMPTQSQTIHPILKDNILKLETEEEQISAPRKEELHHLAEEINALLGEQDTAKVMFVCTHNSRRSQLAQLWLNAASMYYEVSGLEAYSGGTAATAFNQRMVDAVTRAGFILAKTDDTENPRYFVKRHSDAGDGVVLFSKTFDDPFNPHKDFVAVMVCSQADHDCPVVPGAFARVSIPYADPKTFDGTDREQQAYDDKVHEIGREILYLARVLGSMED